MTKCTQQKLDYAKKYQAEHYEAHKEAMKKYYHCTTDKAKVLVKQNARRLLFRELAINRAILLDVVHRGECV